MWARESTARMLRAGAVFFSALGRVRRWTWTARNVAVGRVRIAPTLLYVFVKLARILLLTRSAPPAPQRRLLSRPGRPPRRCHPLPLAVLHKQCATLS